MIKRKFLYSLVLSALLVSLMVSAAAAGTIYNISGITFNPAAVNIMVGNSQTLVITVGVGSSSGASANNTVSGGALSLSREDVAELTFSTADSGIAFDANTNSYSISTTITAEQTMTVSIKGLKKGSSVLTVSNSNLTSSPTITINVVEPETPVLTSTTKLGTATYGTTYAAGSAFASITVKGVDASKITFSDLGTASTALAASGLKFGDYSSSGETGTLPIIGTAKHIGEYQFTLTPYDSDADLTGTSKTYTLKVTGDAPTVNLYDGTPTAATILTTGFATGTYGTVYDEDNNGLFVGKDVAKEKTQASENTIVFYVKGAKEDLTISGKFDDDSCGLTFVPGSKTVGTTDTYTAFYAGTLTGKAAKAGTFNLTITAENAQTKNIERKATVVTFPILIKPAPTIEEPSITKIVWGEKHDDDDTKILFQAANADSIAIVDAAQTAGVWLDKIGSQTDAGDYEQAKIEAATGMEFSSSAKSSTTGRAEIYLKGTWKPGVDDDTADDGSELEAPTVKGSSKKFKLIAWGGDSSKPGSVYVTKDITLTFETKAPVITLDEAALKALTYKPDDALDNYKIATVEGPGTLSWNETEINNALPKGLMVDTQDGDHDEGTTFDLKIKGKPIEITDQTVGKGIPLKATSTLSGSTLSSTAAAHLFVDPGDFDEPTLGADDSYKLPEGWTAVKDGSTVYTFANIYEPLTGSTFTNTVADSPTAVTGLNLSKFATYALDGAGAAYTGSVTPATKGTAGTDSVELFVEPGPITWKASNLPENVTLVADTVDTRFAYLVFDTAANGFTGATKKTVSGSGNSKTYTSEYSITATNKYLPTTTNTFTGNLVVWEKPSVTSLSKSSIKVDDTADWNNVMKVAGDPTSFTIVMNNATDMPADTPNEEWHANATTAGEKTIAFSSDDLKFTGGLDRIPQYTPTGATKPVNGFIMTITPKNFAGEGDAFTHTVTATGTAPALENLGELIFDAGNDTQAVKITKGTKDVALTAKIAASDAAKAGLDGETSLTGVTASDTTAKFSFSDDGEGAGTISFNGGGNYAFKGLPITVTATNRAGTATKSYKVTVNGADPTWDYSDQTETTVAGDAYPAKIFTATVTKPYEIKVSPAEYVDKNGLLATKSNNTVTVSGRTPDSKETKTTFTMTATNTSTKQKAVLKYTINALKKPEITTVAGKLDKEVIVGKKISAKPAVKGSKGYIWAVATKDNAPAASAVSETALNNYGITLDPQKGLASDKTTKITIDANNDYEPKTVKLVTYNPSVDVTAANRPTYDITFGIKGEKPKVTTKNVSLKKGSIGSVKLVTTPEVNANDNVKIKFDMEDTISGIDVNETTGELEIYESQLIATKGTAVPVTINNAGSVAKSNVKFIIDDPKPEIEDFSIDDIQALAKSKATKVVTVKVTDETFTGDTSIKWAITKQPSKASAKIKSSGNGGTATITLTVAKNLTNANDADIEDSISITATNQRTKDVSNVKTVSFTINPVATTTALPEGSAIAINEVTRVALPEATARKSAGEGEVKLGTTRTVAGLTAGENTIVHEEGYIVAAVLPEVTVTEDGQYDLNVELAETVKEGAELKYFAFPRNAEASDDDEIVDFYDDEGAEIEAVPESHKITVAPWFNADVTYAPVIAVKADTGDEAAKTVDEIEEIVTVEEAAK